MRPEQVEAVIAAHGAILTETAAGAVAPAEHAVEIIDGAGVIVTFAQNYCIGTK